MFFDVDSRPLKAYGAEARALLKLTLPMFVAQVAQVGTGFVDTAMAGRYGVNDLAAVALGTSIFVTFYVTLISFPTALNPILSQALGANDKARLGRYARQGLYLCALTGVLAMLAIWLLIAPIQRFLALGPEVQSKLTQFLIVIATALPAALIQKAFHSCAASLNRTQVLMWVSLVALGLNVPLNYMLIYGAFGLPQLGGVGCAWATSIVFWFGAIVLWVYFRRSAWVQPYRLFMNWERPEWRSFRVILALALPITLSFFLEVSQFSFIAFLVARFGVQYVASQQVVMNIAAMVYMVPQTLAAALTARVGHALGENDRPLARYRCGVALSMGALVALLVSSMLLIWRKDFVGLYTQDAQIIQIGGQLLIFAAAFQLFDFIQTLSSGALRGYRYTRVPMLIHALCFWGVGLGGGGILAFYFDWRVYGFWSGMIGALSLAALLLGVSLRRISR